MAEYSNNNNNNNSSECLNCKLVNDSLQCLKCKQYICFNCKIIKKPKDFLCVSCSGFETNGSASSNETDLEAFKRLLNNLKERVENCEMKTRLYYDTLRFDIDLSTESLIMLLNKYRDELLNSVENIEANQLETMKNSVEISDINENLKRFEMNGQNGGDMALLRRGVEEKIHQFDKFLLEKCKKLIFKEPIFQLTSEFIGKLDLKESITYEYAIEKLRMVGDNKIEYGKHISNRVIDYSMCTLTPSNKIILLIGFKRCPYHTIRREVKDKCFEYQVCIYSTQTRQLISLFNKIDTERIECIKATNKYIYLIYVNSKQLDVFDMDMNLVKTISLSFYPMRLFTSNKQLYVLAHQFQTPMVHVIDTNTHCEINAFGQGNNFKEAYYLNNDDIEISDGLVFTCHHADFSIISIESGLVIKKFRLNDSIFYFKILPRSLNKILFSNSTTKQFEVYDYDGKLIEKVETKCKIRSLFNFCINENFEIIFDDGYNKTLYTN